MKRYHLILRMFLKAKFIFKNPRKYDLVIFDNESISVFQNFISDYDFFVLQVRIKKINKIYCTFKLLKYFFKYYKGNIMTAYLLSLIEIVSPKVILTNIDNSFKFSELNAPKIEKINPRPSISKIVAINMKPKSSDKALFCFLSKKYKNFLIIIILLIDFQIKK